MSTLKTEAIVNGTSTVDFPTNVQIANGVVVRYAYSQASEPANARAGEIWWDTSASVVKILLGTKWCTLS